MSKKAVIGYETATAAPVELTDSDLDDWTLVESREDGILRLAIRWYASESTLLLDFDGGLSGRAAHLKRVEPGEASAYAFSCERDEGRYSELLARGLAAALNLNEEEHIALLSATRTYYANAESGGVISISSMLPDKPRQLDLLKSKLEELTVIPPTFGSEKLSPQGMEVDLSLLDSRYARRALANALAAKYVCDHRNVTLIIGSFEEMLPEAQTKSMRYPLEMATSLLWTLRGIGVKLIAHSRKPLPRELDGVFRTRIVEGEEVRMKRAGTGWREVYLLNDVGARQETLQGVVVDSRFDDEEALTVVLSTIGGYANVSYAGLVSFLKGRMEEKRVQEATDYLLRNGSLELTKGPGEAHYLSLTEAGRSLRNSLEETSD
jgi:hypothetical protein